MIRPVEWLKSLGAGVAKKLLDNINSMAASAILAGVAALTALFWGSIQNIYNDWKNIEPDQAMEIARRVIPGTVITAEGIRIKGDEKQYIIAYAEDFRGNGTDPENEAVLISAYDDTYTIAKHFPAYVNALRCLNPLDHNCMNSDDPRTPQDILSPFVGAADIDGDGNREMFAVKYDYSTGSYDLTINVYDIESATTYVWKEEGESQNWFSAERKTGFSENVVDSRIKKWLKSKADEFYWSGGAWMDAKRTDYDNGLLINKPVSTFDDRYARWLRQNGQGPIKSEIILTEAKAKFGEDATTTQCEENLGPLKLYIKFKQPGIQLYDTTTGKNYVAFVPAPDSDTRAAFIVGKQYIWLSAHHNGRLAAIEKAELDPGKNSHLRIEQFYYSLAKTPENTASTDSESEDEIDLPPALGLDNGILKFGDSQVMIDKIDMADEFQSATLCETFD
jgi:hypothetical protein